MNHDELVVAYTAPGRHYHNLAHIKDCLGALARVDNLSAAEREILTHAIWWHDVVYDATRADNEELSARLAEAYVQLSNSPPLSSSGSTGRSSIPEAARLEPRSCGVLGPPVKPEDDGGEDVTQRSRGRKCPSVAVALTLSIRRGCREYRMLAAPAGLACKEMCISRTQETTGQPEQPAFPAQWLYGLYVISSACRAF